MFKTEFNGQPIHVLQVRGRTAFLAQEIGAAAGYAEGGRRFVQLIVHEWAASLDEDDDIAQITGAELAAIRREVPLPETATVALVLFTFGVERTLTRADARYAKPLLGFLHKDVLSRVISLAAEPTPKATRDDDSDGDSGPTAPPPPAGSLWDVVGMMRVTTGLRQLEVTSRLLRYHGVRRLGAKLLDEGMIDEGTAADLEVEALEVLLGRPLRTRLPRFGNPDDAPLAA
jgi:hypothetical protein